MYININLKLMKNNFIRKELTEYKDNFLILRHINKTRDKIILLKKKRHY